MGLADVEEEDILDLNAELRQGMQACKSCRGAAERLSIQALKDSRKQLSQEGRFKAGDAT